MSRTLTETCCKSEDMPVVFKIGSWDRIIRNEHATTENPISPDVEAGEHRDSSLTHANPVSSKPRRMPDKKNTHNAPRLAGQHVVLDQNIKSVRNNTDPPNKSRTHTITERSSWHPRMRWYTDPRNKNMNLIVKVILMVTNMYRLLTDFGIRSHLAFKDNAVAAFCKAYA